MEPLYRYPKVRRFVSRLVIDKYGKATSPRPRPLSMAGDYTTWRSLTDRTFSGRHLPPPTGESPRRPPEAEVAALFRREQMLPADDTSVAFGFFAQWFTDSFLRTSKDSRKTSSNHEIDLCQIYGLTEEKTAMLRGENGRLASQLIGGEEYPLYLHRENAAGDLEVDPRFANLHPADTMAAILGRVPNERRRQMFAVGLEYGNSTIGHVMLNTMFLREHNRVAAILEAKHPKWGSDALFETTRNVLIVELLKIVIEDYIKHIGPKYLPLELVPFVAEKRNWNRPNWIAVEFNLLYRWHSLVPDTIGDGDDALEHEDFLDNNQLVIDSGIEALMAQCSRTRAGRIGLQNTPTFLVDRDGPADPIPSVMERTVSLMRKAKLASYNDYRVQFGLERLTSYDQLTSDDKLIARLESLYGGIENLEWYVGLFAEDPPPGMDLMMGELLGTMVGYDAFTQALTNPLLARNVYNEATFSKTGMQIIAETRSLEQIFVRNSTRPQDVVVDFSC
ncbi:hypothetical protein OG921_18645 [Aldersonia sp. NBC_00410]|uniref:peroxidase family protein n=1 Tax=Aldersonia sp. NBC_00410 TaxID=2975954 RepID=UPI00225175AF|nr:peroxidase family protein [Aldersonia sp. NBC_00410]MCX5045189.1 hypothetical protein [Aldersonia sp. NBC_00410]